MKTTILLTLFVLVSLNYSEVRLCGVQADDLNLKPENNPYIITGDIVLKPRTLWTINPGVVIKVASAASACSLGHGSINEPDKGGLIAICVQGSFQCVGGSDKRIIIEPLVPEKSKVTWYGIILDNANTEFTKIYYSDISGALYGVKIRNCSPVIRNCVLTKNQTGIFCASLCKSKIFNNNIVYNYSTGILNENATPEIFSNIIAYNLTGIWSDNRSDMEILYNDFWQNSDGNLNSCPPKFGILCEINKRKDSCDFKKNIFIDPVFFGSPSHADSIAKDLRVPTDTSKADVVNKKLSRVVVKAIPDSLKKSSELNAPHKPWQLSRYSHLIDAGNPKSPYKDPDGTSNDIGVTGGSEFKFE